jgi:hypothetical protein
MCLVKSQKPGNECLKKYVLMMVPNLFEQIGEQCRKWEVWGLLLANEIKMIKVSEIWKNRTVWKNDETFCKYFEWVREFLDF